MHQRARSASTGRSLIARDDDDVNGDAERRQGIAQTNHLGELAGDVILDHQEIQIAVSPARAASPRTEENHLGRRARLGRECATSLEDRLVINHNVTVSQAADRAVDE